MASDKLTEARKQKNDEFYTQINDIKKEMDAYFDYNPNVFKGKTILCPCDDPEWSNFTLFFAKNFKKYGIKKLISTSYAKSAGNKEISLFEKQSPNYDEEKHSTQGKIFVLDHDIDKNGEINEKDLEFYYLKGDGDFRSEEVRKLRDEADIIITNPPFSLFREFLAWILEENKDFIIIGNLNAITYKDVFPLIKDNKIWLGATCFTGGATYFIAPKELYSEEKMSNPKHSYLDDDGKFYWRVNGVRWFTNIEHGHKHEKRALNPIENRLKHCNKLKNKLLNEYGKLEYPKYDNYDAIEVPYSDTIPSDYDGVMGVPISFLDNYCPEQFEILGLDKDFTYDKKRGTINGKQLYARIFIRKKVGH